MKIPFFSLYMPWNIIILGIDVVLSERKMCYFGLRSLISDQNLFSNLFQRLIYGNITIWNDYKPSVT